MPQTVKEGLSVTVYGAIENLECRCALFDDVASAVALLKAQKGSTGLAAGGVTQWGPRGAATALQHAYKLPLILCCTGLVTHWVSGKLNILE